jgi:uncharacterized secreted repeat protein (TIGR03808 family)
MPKIDRRHVLFAAGASASPLLMPSSALASGTAPTTGIDATQFGVRPGSAADQSGVMQRAIDEAARLRTPLFLPAGTYRAANLMLPAYAKVVGVRGATRIALTFGPSLIGSNRADYIELSGLVLDGGARKLPKDRGLVHLSQGASVRIADCEILNSGGHGIVLEKIGGALRDNTVTGTADAAIHSLDAAGLTISGNVVRGSGNNGIRVWTSTPAYDGTVVSGNVIEDTRADAGGDGPYGNAINVFRAGHVLVQGNRIRNAAFTAVRGNSASNIQIIGNNCSGLGEVAIYSEFSFEGALIAQNVVDGAMNGISVTNFDVGGRLAVVQGNLIRNLVATTLYEGQGVGILADADTAVTGNVIENAPSIGLALGYGPYLRDLVASDNIIRGAGIGIAVSVVPGAGSALIANNLITETKRGAILGMHWHEPVTGDLAREGAARYAQLTVERNRVQ